MPTRIPSADDGGTRAYRANLETWRPTTLPIWRFLLAAAVVPPLLVAIAEASWLAWTCLQGVMGTAGVVIALAGVAALAALIRRHTGMEVGMALCLTAAAALVGMVWVVLALLAVELVAGAWTWP